MSRGWAAVADIGRGLMERDARKKELEEERKYAQEQADAQWEREADKRKAEEELRLLRIETEKAKAARERQGLALDAGNAQIGKVVGGQRFYQKPVEGSEGLFEIGREEVGPTAAERLRSEDSRARTGAIQSSANARQAASIDEKRRAEANDLEMKRIALEVKLAQEGQWNPRNDRGITAEEKAAAAQAAYAPAIQQYNERIAQLRGGEALVQPEEKGKGPKRNPEFDAAIQQQRKENPKASEAALKAFVEQALGIKEYL